jgi:hypothetical protein
MDPQVKMRFQGDERSLTQALGRIEDSGQESMRTISKSASDAEDALKGVRQAADSIKPVDVQVTADTSKAESDIRGVSDEGRPVDIPVKADTSKAESSIKGVEGHNVDLPVKADTGKAKEAIEGLADLGTDIGDKFSGGLASGLKVGLSGAIAAIGGVLVDSVVDKISEGNKIQKGLEATFKLPPGIAEQYKNLFNTSVVEDFVDMVSKSSDVDVQWLNSMGVGADELAATMARMSKTFHDFNTLGVADQRALTVEMAKVATAAGVDITDALKGADVASRTFGLSAWDSVHLVDRGFSEMGLRADDWAETLNEYPRYFQQMGLSADDMFRVIKSGMDAGAMNTDKVADSFKELGIRIIDQSAGTKEALHSLGFDADAMSKTIAAGGPPARAALDSVIDRLRDMQDPLERNRLGVLLMGSQWEDSMRAAITSTDIAVGSTYEWGRAVIVAAQNASGQGDAALRKMVGSMNDVQLRAQGATVTLDQLGNRVVTLPDGKVITVTANDMASSTIYSIAGRNYSAVIRLTGVWAGYYGLPNGVVLSGSSARGNAEGGWIDGPGTRTSDSVPRMLSKDEFVVKADEANRGDNPRILEAINSGRTWRSGGPAGRGYAEPGGVPGGGGGGGGGARVTFAGNLDSAFASAFMKLVRSGDIQIS